MVDGEGSTPSGFISAREALAFVAYGDPAALDGLPPGAPDMLGRWGYVANSWDGGRRTGPLVRLRWVWARVRWRLTRHRRRGRWRRCPLLPLGPEGRAYVRYYLRKHDRPAPEVIDGLRADIERARLAAADRLRRLRQADRDLCSAIADGSLPVFGRRGRAADGSFTDLEHEAVPPTFFLNRHRTLNMIWEWATLGAGAPLDEWALCRTQGAPDWGDLRFPRSALLARFPRRTAPMEPLPAALMRFSDPTLLRRHAEALARLRPGEQWHQDLAFPQHPDLDRLCPADTLEAGELAEAAKLRAAIDAAFVAKLTKGELVAWARPRSPMAALQGVPAIAWRSLQIRDLTFGTAAGPDTILFDLHVARRPELVQAPQSSSLPSRRDASHQAASAPPEMSDIPKQWAPVDDTASGEGRVLVLRGNAPDHLATGPDRVTEHTLRDVTLAGSDAGRVWRPANEGVAPNSDAAPGVARAASTIAAEKRLEFWLVERMRASPYGPPGKGVVKAEAKADGHRVSVRAFSRAYANAVAAANAPAWSAPGRKSKRRIDMPEKT